jgi:hypothetical protein
MAGIEAQAPAWSMPAAAMIAAWHIGRGVKA